MNETFSAVHERVDAFDLSQIHTPEEWQLFFDDVIVLLDHDESRTKDYALDRMQKGVWSENSQHFQQSGFKPPAAEKRLMPILDAIMRQPLDKVHYLLRFTRWSSFSEAQMEFFANWLERAESNDTISYEVAKAAQIQTKLYQKEDWNLAKSFLEPFFDHPNDLLRAAAAKAFGAMYANDADNLPALHEMMLTVKEWEIVRPGFAGPFLGELLLYAEPDGEIADSGVQIHDWILEIIAKRVTAEPTISLYCSLDFHAHEILSSSPSAVRKLIDFGAETVAANAATEENRQIDGMQELLEELVYSSDNFVSRICSWHLANNYHYLHPEGVRREFVQYEQREDVDIFLVLHPEEHGSRPYAATFYPKEQVMNDVCAWKWIDKLIPPELRPSMEENEWPFMTPQIRADSAMYVYGHYIAILYGDSEKKQWTRVWVKWPLDSSKW